MIPAPKAVRAAQPAPRLRRATPAHAAIAALRHCELFLQGVTDQQYASGHPVGAGASIGQHVRHALDHFGAVLSGRAGGGTIDYDRRVRDTPVEKSRREGLAAIAALLSGLDGLPAEEMDAPVRVRVMLSGAGDEAELGSTFGRELAFAAHHAVHHFAIMSMIGRAMGAFVPDAFGKAPSTLHHEGERA
jgi:hypothetical protein